jgi:hypothetical protein
MIDGVPLSNALEFCGLFALGSVRSDGLLRRLRSCGFPGFTPGARPVVPLSGAEFGARPGADPPGLLGPVVALPGVLEVPVPVPEEVPPALAPPPDAPPELPPPPPPPCANAIAPESTSIVRTVPVRFIPSSRPGDTSSSRTHGRLNRCSILRVHQRLNAG